jgi:hypothetical protein
MREWIAGGALESERKVWTRTVADVLTRALER